VNEPYALGLLSPIPVIPGGEDRRTLDLWARDLAVQISQTSRLKLFCPVVPKPPAHWTATAPLPAGIEVLDVRRLSRAGLREALAGCDVLQVSGNQGWYEGRDARRMVRQARHLGIRCIVGISSNRARSEILNARERGLLSRAKALVRYGSIRFTQRLLTASTDGTFVVGEGLRPLVSPRCPTLHVSIASWIREDDLRAAAQRAESAAPLPLQRLCIASRLERMKGVHLGIDAFARLCGEDAARDAHLTVLGAGPERAALEARASAAGLSARVTFGGTRSYPEEFFAEVRRHGVVLLTNLSDEQPRLVFDAISQGALPLCPDSPAYTALGLPPDVLYRRGDAADLAEAIRRIWRHPSPPQLLADVLAVARRFTLESMHRARAAWIESEVLSRHPDARASAA
jgi:glycosyltransferase involved in cell wall biosynthesis